MLTTSNFLLGAIWMGVCYVCCHCMVVIITGYTKAQRRFDLIYFYYTSQFYRLGFLHSMFANIFFFDIFKEDSFNATIR